MADTASAEDILRRIALEQGRVPPDLRPEQRCAPPDMIDRLKSSKGVPL